MMIMAPRSQERDVELRTSRHRALRRGGQGEGQRHEAEISGGVWQTPPLKHPRSSATLSVLPNPRSSCGVTMTFFVAHDSLSAHAVSRASSVFNSSSSSNSTGRASSLRKLGSTNSLANSAFSDARCLSIAVKSASSFIVVSTLSGFTASGVFATTDAEVARLLMIRVEPRFVQIRSRLFRLPPALPFPSPSRRDCRRDQAVAYLPCCRRYCSRRGFDTSRRHHRCRKT